jgi:hypothetical protein
VAQTEASGYVDSQYVMRPEFEGDKSDIFARTSVANHKLRMADNVSGSGTDVVEDAFGSSHLSVAASADKFNSESKMSSEVNLGDNLSLKK